MGDASFWSQAITLGVALLGAALGVLNTWHTMTANRVRLRVRPGYAHATDAQGRILSGVSPSFYIEVLNLSGFPLLVSEVGFTLDSRTTRTPRVPVTRPEIRDGGPWPRRLPPRESVTVYFEPIDLMGLGSRMGRAYVHTACGEIAYGTSPALKQLKELLAP